MVNRKDVVLKMDYEWLDDLIEEAELFLIVHDGKIVYDEDDGYSITDPWGCWTVAPRHWSKEDATASGAIWLYLWMKGCTPPVAEELAVSYIWRTIQQRKHTESD